MSSPPAERARAAPKRVLRLLLLAATDEGALKVAEILGGWSSEEVVSRLEIELSAAVLTTKSVCWDVPGLRSEEHVVSPSVSPVMVVQARCTAAQAAKIDAVASGRGNVTHLSADIKNDHAFHVARTH
jgi:hypothetical protein